MCADRTIARVDLALIGLAFFYLLIEWLPGIIGPYGYFIDEFYYIACSHHLAAGYVDHPPLSILLLWVIRNTIGDGLPAIRFIPALAGGATILVTGLIARRLGANSFGQLIAAMAAMVGTIFQISFSFYSMNAISILMWALAFLVLVEIDRADRPRLWLLFGALSGVALQMKHTFILLLIGLFLGLLVTRARRHLTNRYFWGGAGIAFVIVLPNLLWQSTHSWASLEFYRNADLYKNIPTPPLEVIKQQILTMGPGALPVWLAGLIYFLADSRMRKFRHLGWIYITLLLMMLIAGKSRPDRISDAYIALFAGGGALIGDLTLRARLRWIRWALPVLMIVTGAALAPLGLPLLSPPSLGRYSSTLGVTPQIEKGEGKRSELPQWFADRLGWEQFVDDVAAVASELAPEERAQAVTLAPSYGQAGAIELFGRGRNLPPVYSGQNSYYHWGPPPDSVSAAIVMEPFSEEDVRELFDDVRFVRVYDNGWCPPWRDHSSIWIARRQKAPLGEAWRYFKHYE